ncbi:MAG: isoprenyl transferase [Alphaproteobacteria bacterium]|nr:isoprenyl transferase [Alphaproteobacteria bacterium]
MQPVDHPFDKDAIKTPMHVAIIMDGNGRWAAARGLPRTMGHRAGIEAVKRTLEACKSLPVKYLTLYSFSAENWRRPLDEIEELMQLLRFYLRSELANMHRNGIRVRIIGERDKLPKDIVDMVNHAEELTKDNQALTLVIALSYGARQEIAAAARAIAEKVSTGALRPAQVDEGEVMAALYTHDLPDPDLIIRTSGEQRLSNFLLWQSAYAEFFFTETLWPDFGARDLEAALGEFQRRERRYGATVGQN